MRKPFLITLLITFIGAISWGMYVSKTNPLDYLFEIGVVLMGLGISILWQMKVFILKPENKMAFANWRKSENKKFVTLFMRDEQRMLPFIVPLAYLARALVIFGVMIALGDWFFGGVENIIDTYLWLLLVGFFMSLWGVLSIILYSYGLIGAPKQEIDMLEKWKQNPSFMHRQNDSKAVELAPHYILGRIEITTMQVGILYFFAGLIIWLIN